MITDTICAISTPPGSGGIAVARISGPEAIDVVMRRWKGKDLNLVPSHSVHLGTVTDSAGRDLDQAVATIFRAPASYTGDDVIELSVHGSPFIQRELILSLIDAGARLAERGEFTRRAHAAGKLDLAQAEAVADIIAADSRAAHRIAISQMKGNFSRRLAQLRDQLIEISSLLELELDFSEEEVEFASRSHLLQLATDLHNEITRLSASFRTGNAIRRGIPVAIIGPTNAGKSSLLNTLLGDNRAIVSDIHGTTRDTIEETLEIGDYLFRFIDTAGIRPTDDPIEQQGIDRSISAISRARIIISLIDPFNTDEASHQALDSLQYADSAHIIHAINKADLPGYTNAIRTLNISDPIKISATTGQSINTPTNVIELSATTRQGIDTLRNRLTEIAAADDAPSDIIITNIRHADALTRAGQSIQRVITALSTDLPGDLIAQDLRETILHLSEITDPITTDELLQTIFTRFCIGK